MPILLHMLSPLNFTAHSRLFIHLLANSDRTDYKIISLADQQWRSQDFKVRGTPMTWPEEPMWGWVFWGGAAQRALSLSARRSGGELSLPLTEKKSPICKNPVAMPVDGRLACPPMATLLPITHTASVFTALHVMQTRYSDENSVRLSVHLSVRPSQA